MKSLRRFIPMIALSATLLAGVQPAFAAVRVEGVGENLPFYAREFSIGEWTVVIFYRPPDCVPDDFDLVNVFFDFGATACGPATTDGFEVWRTGPGFDPAPLQLNLTGLGAVPIYYVKTAEVNAALLDGDLTLAEIEAMPSLKVGYATHYREILHPLDGARVPKITVVAWGTFTDGTPFRLKIPGVGHTK